MQGPGGGSSPAATSSSKRARMSCAYSSYSSFLLGYGSCTPCRRAMECPPAAAGSAQGLLRPAPTVSGMYSWNFSWLCSQRCNTSCLGDCFRRPRDGRLLLRALVMKLLLIANTSMKNCWQTTPDVLRMPSQLRMYLTRFSCLPVVGSSFTPM